MQMAGVTAELYPSLAHIIRPFLAKFTGDGANTIEDFEAKILAQDMQAWIGGDNGVHVVCLTEIGTDRLKTCHVSYCGGDSFRDWIPLIDRICDFARSIGCARVRVTCRPGYERYLSQHAFRKTHIIMDRSL